MGAFCRKSTMLLPLLWLFVHSLNAESTSSFQPKFLSEEAFDALYEIFIELPRFFKAKYSHNYLGAFKVCAPENQTKSGFRRDRSSTNFTEFSGVPGVDFPVYDDIPETSFTCFDKPRIPGMYADQETRCQVFHVCQTTEIESMLCPNGTTFNQAIRACDYWYKSNCSMAPHYYTNPTSYPYFSHIGEILRETLGPFFDTKLWKARFSRSYSDFPPVRPAAERLVSFLPIKFKTTVYSDTGSFQTEKTVNWLEWIGKEKSQSPTAEHESLNEGEALLEQADLYSNSYWDYFDPEDLCEWKKYVDMMHFIATHGLTDFFFNSLRDKLRADLKVEDVNPSVIPKLVPKSVEFPNLHEKTILEQIKRINFMEPETEINTAGSPSRSPNRRRVVPEMERTQEDVHPTSQPDDSVSNTLFRNFMKLMEELP